MAAQDTSQPNCGNCKWFAASFIVTPRKVSPGLTEMGGVYGYCEWQTENDATVPIWSNDILRRLEPPLTTAQFGRGCPTFEQAEQPLDTSRARKADHA